ncbi:unnamed protein product [Linum tenue]|uniref:F-box domain-containing protein n=1 Tax=Linum tenue TaxID=586396 RepID=A0AAV0MV72_9ROSI|nr:unnamed protein product [Linum tenue]
MTTINKLGDDLLIEILIRSFPNPESACRRKLVCKRWSSLILSDPTFNRRFVSHHRSRPPPPPSTTSFHHRQYLSFLPVPDELWPYFTVWDASNDLLLCGFSGQEVSRTYELMRRFYLVCNSFTKQWCRPSSGAPVLLAAI